MELNELKAKWNELDARLTQVETINKKALRELTAMRTASSLTHLRNHSRFSVLVTLTVSAFMIYFLGHNEELNAIMSPYSIMAMIAALILGSFYVLYRSVRISQLDVTMPTTELMARSNSLRRFLLMESHITYVGILVLYALVFCFERNWIIERGRVVPAIILFIALCIFVTIAMVNGKRQNQKMLNEIDSNLKELSEL